MSFYHIKADATSSVSHCDVYVFFVDKAGCTGMMGLPGNGRLVHNMMVGGCFETQIDKQGVPT